jgi:uncharacterized protein YciW
MEIVKSGLKADSTLSPAERARLLRVLRQAEDPNPKPEPPAAPCILQRREVAKRLSRSLRYVDKLAACGTLRKITMPGRLRAIGFAEQDVCNLIAGSFAE